MEMRKIDLYAFRWSFKLCGFGSLLGVYFGDLKGNKDCQGEKRIITF
jgi:hypothetical protein